MNIGLNPMVYFVQFRVVSSTPDIVKSVEENKAEEADKSENNNDAIKTKGRQKFRAHFC